ncbi:MAG: hypothetical protein J7604_22705 [Sporocytophaga sp.]|uniref:hypothetical protein n=1 Tax=Sporocytophaga sp. TaxID=2231183 RepID=UPI001B28EBBA|nr:hypothetical protein [Sporocytophaga sp.]MBO9703043.1 hypothetical protein [Sporocytophaga sp.]
MNEKFRNINVYNEEVKAHEKKAGEHATFAIIGFSAFLIFVYIKKKFNLKSERRMIQ